MTNREKIKYYIIKDLDTGLYYRGKGQNRWGKYYNQASIFRNLAQAHNSVEELKRYYKSNAVAIEIEINEQTNTSFEECIKEWKKRGYLCFLSKEPKLLDISNLEEYSVIKIGLENKHYIKVDSVLYSSFIPITFEEHNLIHKTLKALEEMKDE